MSRLLYPRKGDTIQKATWDPGPVRTGAGNFAPTGIRSPDRRASTDYAMPDQQCKGGGCLVDVKMLKS